MSVGLLEVAVDQARDVPGALEGGADRLSLAVGPEGDRRSPDLSAASAVLRPASLMAPPAFLMSFLAPSSAAIVAGAAASSAAIVNFDISAFMP